MKTNRRYVRKCVDISMFPMKAELLIDNEIVLIGKVWDLSRYGICLVTDYLLDENLVGDRAKLKIKKVEHCVDLNVTVKWRDHSYTNDFYGIESEEDLMETELSQYLE